MPALLLVSLKRRGIASRVAHLQDRTDDAVLDFRCLQRGVLLLLLELRRCRAAGQLQPFRRQTGVEIAALAFRNLIPVLLRQRVDKAWFDHLAGNRVDLAGNRVMQASAVRWAVASHLRRLVGCGLVELIFDSQALELIHLILALVDALSDGREFITRALHCAADLTALRILDNAAGIEPTFSNLKRNGCH